VNVLDKAADFIAEFEGCRLDAYRDQRGIWTCGYGATGHDISARTRWTQDQADDRFERDLDIRLQQLNDFLENAPTTDNQRVALLSLGYNIGMGALKGSTALRRHIAGDHKGAAKAILMWDKVNGKQNPGLTRRRNAEHDLYLSED
jgi:lysozyme